MFNNLYGVETVIHQSIFEIFWDFYSAKLLRNRSVKTTFFLALLGIKYIHCLNGNMWALKFDSVIHGSNRGTFENFKFFFPCETFELSQLEIL